MILGEAVAVIGVVISMLNTEVSKHYINKVLNANKHLKELAKELDGKLDELKKILERMDADSAGYTYLHSDWVEDLEQMRYELEDIQHSEDSMLAARSLTAEIERVSGMLKALQDGKGYAKVENTRLASLYKLLADDSLREEETRKIIQELTKEESGSPGVSIIGLPGLGKTALAKAIANDAGIKDRFHCINTPPYAPDVNLDRMLEHIKDVVSSSSEESKGKRVLVLLDGIPALPDPAQWVLFRSQLLQLEKGSKFLITTQNPQVADVSGTSKHCLEPLKDDECFFLIQKYATLNGELSNDDKRALVHNQKELVGKCRGLPLLANNMGVLLSAAPSGGRGRAIQQLTSPSEAHAGLELLLARLNPASSLVKKPHMKRCLAYFSLFPQDYEFKEESLIQFWMAEGFTPLSPTETHARSLHKAAKQNFQDLCSYSLFPKSKSPIGDEPCYKMHEVAYDLAHYLSSKLCLQAHLGTSLSLPSPSNMSKVRHVSLSCDYVANVQDIVTILLDSIKDKFRGLRTFLLFDDAGKNIPKNPTFFEKLTSLRVLDLSHTNLNSLKQGSISKLKCLRYLDLSHTPLQLLPKLSSNLLLQVLKLNDCEKLLELPKNFEKMTNLISLQVNAASLGSLPPSIGKLSSLQELDKFIVGIKEGYKIEELRNLDDLAKSLHISQLENVKTKDDAEKSMLRNKVMLDRLELEWTTLSDQRRGNSSEQAGEVFEGLVPPKNLKELVIINYYGSEYPQWLNTPEVCGLLRSLHLDSCDCEILPSVDQLECLKTLRVEAMEDIAHSNLSVQTGTVHHGFPHVEQLVLCNMSKLNGWIDLAVNHMPQLRILQLDKCKNLIELPPLDRLIKLEKLQIKRCPQLEKLPELLSTAFKRINISHSGISQQEVDRIRNSGVEIEIDSTIPQPTASYQSSRTPQESSSTMSQPKKPFYCVGRRTRVT